MKSLKTESTRTELNLFTWKLYPAAAQSKFNAKEQGKSPGRDTERLQ